MPTPNAPPPEAVARFQQALKDLVGASSPGGGESPALGLAVSGGPDSMALLRLAHAALPGAVTAATVDHGLRPEARAEAAFVAATCAELEVPHVILGPEPLASGNIQQEARRLRYRLLGQWADRGKIGFIATAHHRDDVAESFLMRAVRGSGTRGLARMVAIGPLPHANTSVRLIRPLLSWTRAELAAIAGPSVQDPSNEDGRYDRARIRAMLRREPLLDPAGLARSASNLADAEAALEWMAQAAWQSRARRTQDGIAVDPVDLPREIRRRLVESAVAELDPLWTGEGLDGVLCLLNSGMAATLGGVAAAPSGDGVWQFRLAPPRRHNR